MQTNPRRETLGDALDRLNLQPLPPDDVLAAMDEETRRKTIRASVITDMDELPAWYRKRLEDHALATLAEIEASEAAQQAS